MKKPFRRQKQKSKKTLVEGIAKKNPKGFGWLETTTAKREGIFIPPREMMYLMDGDIIRCKIVPNPKGPIAYVEEVVTRAHKTLVGSFNRKKNREWVQTQDQIFSLPIYLKSNSKHEKNQIADGTLVQVEITRYPSPDQSAEGTILQVIGNEGDFSSEIEMILLQNKAQREFAPETINQSHTFGENPTPEECQNRKDLTNLPFCTIDGATAKDFDDAVYGYADGLNTWVSVAIADVSAYVTPNSPIDKEALERSTSIYYPGNCIPMIPEALSNGLCSLKPNVPRLSLVADMLVTQNGDIKKVKFHDAVIKSNARLTYNQVQNLMDNDFKAMREVPEKVSQSIACLLKASHALRKARKQRGAIDFDAVESLVALNDLGEPIAINPTERLEAHKLIEDLMIAANETVATFLEEKGWPAIFRVHEKPQPEKLKLFLNLAESVGAIVPADVAQLNSENIEPKALAQIITRFQDHHAKVALDMLMLRSMMQARYSSYNLGHFGLASKSYLHFTSPIRRYPDLMAHRILRRALKQKNNLNETQKNNLTEQLEQIAAHCSDKERKAVDLERQIDALHAVWLMQDKVGEEDVGTITGCAEFGLFLRLGKYHVEGLAHVATLGAGHFTFDANQMQLINENTGQSFKIGDKLNVRVASVNIAKRFIDLEPM
ncbi:MAG: ribonuclease R, partial [bacterium]|nr:ribonuclease R [bacterium]